MLVRVEGAAGRLTLNRPRAINALDGEMIAALAGALDRWRDDPAVGLVVLDGAGERGFCAGGDVRGIAAEIAAGHPERTSGFFLAEYALNAAIAEYPKPVVAIADGITMGGGIGLAGHASLRLVTERSRLAMPETRIGLTPDVGGSWLLARAPGRLGEYLGLTGATMDAADARYAGFADEFVPSAALGERVRALIEGAAPGSEALAADPGPSRLEAARPWIDAAFAADTVPEIVERLRARPEPEAAEAARVLGEVSPTAMAVTMEAVRRARTLPALRDALAQEYGLVMWFGHTQPDLLEGIRAQLIDKDRTPRWRPATPAEVDPAVAASALSYVPSRPLWG